MIKRIFRPMSLLVFTVLATVGVFLLSKYIPKHSVLATSQITLLKSQNETLKITEKDLDSFSKQAELILEKERLHLSPLLNFLVNQPTTTHLFPSKLDLKLFNDNQEVSLNVSLVPSFYKIDTLGLINEKIKSEILEHYTKKLNQQKLEIEKSIATNNQIISTNKLEESAEQVEIEKPVSKPSMTMNNMPPEIAENIVKFKEYKSQKELKLKEIVAQINALPLPNQSPLVMLTSNLQKSYEMQLTVLNSKKDWLKNTDPELLKKNNDDLKIIQEKLHHENIKLRDESYFLKGQQDKALRLQHIHLLVEEKNCREVLDALNELQNGLFEQDQTSVTPQIKINEVVVLKTKDSDINQQKIKKIKQAQSEIAILITSVEEIDKTLSVLKSDGLSTSEPRTTLIPIPYFHNKSILFYLGSSTILLLLLTGLLFGASNKVSSSKFIADTFGAPILGTIPNLPNEGLENAKHKKLTDAIDQVTENLFKSMSAKDIKILNVLSPETNEGRTQLVGMLSLSFNLKKNMKIIALDTCFNNPKLADFLELKTKNQSNEEGLIAYIKNLIETKEISESDNNQWLAKLVKPCIKNGIFVISPGGGSLSDNYSFNSKVISTMYEGLGKYVDLIISDTPPLNSPLSFVSKVLAENSNGNILLIKKGTYKKSDLENIKKKLMGVQILGVILK